MVLLLRRDCAAADPASAGPGVWSEAGQKLYDSERDAALPCQCQTHDVEVADAAQPGSRSCCCCSRCLLSGRAPWRCGTPGIDKKKTCPGLGLFYTMLSALFFSVAALFLKKVEDMHSVEASAFRCIFQMMFVLPGLIYYQKESLT